MPALSANHEYWQQRELAGCALGAATPAASSGMDNLPRAEGQAQADASRLDGLHRRPPRADRRASSATPTRPPRYRGGGREITAAINADLWDDAQGFYFDLDEPGRGFIPTPSYTGLVPLIAGIVPADRVTSILDTIRDERQFPRRRASGASAAGASSTSPATPASS